MHIGIIFMALGQAPDHVNGDLAREATPHVVISIGFQAHLRLLRGYRSNR